MKLKELKSEEELEKAISHGLVLVDFSTPWCAPCHLQDTIICQLTMQFAGKATIAALNIDEHHGIAVRMGISSIPTLVIFKEGKEVQRFVGLQSEATLSEALEDIMDEENIQGEG